MHSRTFKDSGNIPLSNTSTIIAGDIFVFDLDERFIPYNQVSIINNSTELIAVSFTSENIFKTLIPAGNQRVFNIPFENLRIKNLDGTNTVAVDEIVLDLRNDGHEGRKIIDQAKTGVSFLGSLSLIRSFFK